MNLRPVQRMRLALAIAALAIPAPGMALTWTRVDSIPPGDVFSLRRQGTTLYAGTAGHVFIGAANGTVWTPAAPLGVASGVETVLDAGGALWAATFGDGVFRSTNGGMSWDPLDTGLTGLGSGHGIELVEKTGALFLATSGAGIFSLVLALPTQWTAFNAGFPVDTAGNVAALLLHGSTLVAPAGANGFVYRFAPGATLWEEVAIVPPIAPGLLPTDLVARADTLLVGAAGGVWRSTDDAVTWTPASTGIVHGTETFLATRPGEFYAAVDFLGNNHRLYRSHDAGEHWEQIDEQLGSFLFAIEIAGDALFAARADGLWWTPLTPTSTRPAGWGSLKSMYGR
jgi:hypothetical protein